MKQILFCPVWSKKFIDHNLKFMRIRVSEDGAWEKRCSHCDDYFPATSEFFYSAANVRSGLSSWCKGCYQDWKLEKDTNSSVISDESINSFLIGHHSVQKHLSLGVSTEE